MDPAPKLAAMFLAHAKVRFVSPVDAAALERLLVQAWETSRAQWPGVALPAELFVTHLAERLPEAAASNALEPLLASLSLAELYLACACLHGVEAALELFEHHYLAKLPGALQNPKHSNAMLEDICQLARMKLLVPTPEGRPKIAEYTGRGALQSWVRVTTTRIAIKLQSTQKPAPEEDAETLLSALPAPGVDPELDAIKRRHQADLRLAMREAFSTLSSEDRHLLRLYFVDQLSMYELATLFRVTQPTISRWLKSTRETVYKETRRHLQARLGLSQRDFQSFLALLDSQLELSISQLLGAEDAPPRPSERD
jgi:RNA polymerase sigma-70 factor (ECF subfamily)